MCVPPLPFLLNRQQELWNGDLTGGQATIWLSTGAPKKSLCGQAASKWEQGPSAGHSVSLWGALSLSAKWVMRKPRYNELWRVEITVYVVSRSCCWHCLDKSPRLGGHLSWSCGLCVLRKLQNWGLSTRLSAEHEVVCFRWALVSEPVYCFSVRCLYQAEFFCANAQRLGHWLWNLQASLNNNNQA